MEKEDIFDIGFGSKKASRVATINMVVAHAISQEFDSLPEEPGETSLAIEALERQIGRVEQQGGTQYGPVTLEEAKRLLAYLRTFKAP